MSENKPERAEYLKSLLTKFPDVPTKTLARKAYEHSPEWFSNLETARRAIRYYRGNGGKSHRKQAGNKTEFHRENHKAGEVYSLPPSLAESWEPYIIPSEFKKILHLSDIHAPYHATLPLSVAVQYGKDHGCDGVLLNGDIGDWYSVSRYERNPKKRDLKSEVSIVKEMLLWLRDEFPAPKKIIFKKGNHEERWDHFIWNKAPELWDLANVHLENILDLEKMDIDCVGDQRPIMFRDLPIFHGHELGRNGIAAPVNQARGMFLRGIHTMLCGHGHRTSQHTETDLWHKEITCWSVGCLADLHPEYARVNRFNWGFAIVYEVEGGWSVDNRRISLQGKVW